MITLHTTRHYLEAALLQFFPFINLQKQTRLNDVAHLSIGSKEYLQAVVINCLLEEIETIFKKKLVNTSSEKVAVKLTDAQGVLFYQVLTHMPLDGEKWYENQIRNRWLEDLDQEIIRQQIYMHNHPVKSIPVRRTPADLME
jgi:hypothetical protein